MTPLREESKTPLTDAAAQTTSYVGATVPVELGRELESALAAALAAKQQAFSDGARAMFDALLCRATNNYHGNRTTNALCDQENALITEWAETALAEVSPDDCATWHSVTELSARAAALEAELQALRGLLAMAKCPNGCAPGDGWYVDHDPRTGDPVQVQCQWCDETNAAIDAASRQGKPNAD